jgi:hypothetical protein
MARFIGPLTWAYAIIIGGVLILTRVGWDPIVFTAVGVVGIALGIAGFVFGRARTPAAAG